MKNFLTMVRTTRSPLYFVRRAPRGEFEAAVGAGRGGGGVGAQIKARERSNKAIC